VRGKGGEKKGPLIRFQDLGVPLSTGKKWPKGFEGEEKNEMAMEEERGKKGGAGILKIELLLVQRWVKAVKEKGDGERQLVGKNK